jgi:hypothetical protein
MNDGLNNSDDVFIVKALKRTIYLNRQYTKVKVTPHKKLNASPLIKHTR